MVLNSKKFLFMINMKKLNGSKNSGYFSSILYILIFFNPDIDFRNNPDNIYILYTRKADDERKNPSLPWTPLYGWQP